MHFLNKKQFLFSTKVIVLLLVFLLVAAIVMVVPAEHSSAQGGLPFGGMVTSVFFCACSNNFMLTVGPPVGGVFMYQPGATLVYSFYMIPVPGVWLLGLFGPPVACLIPAGRGCMTLGAYPRIIMTGTSM